MIKMARRLRAVSPRGRPVKGLLPAGNSAGVGVAWVWVAVAVGAGWVGGALVAVAGASRVICGLKAGVGVGSSALPPHAAVMNTVQVINNIRNADANGGEDRGILQKIIWLDPTPMPYAQPAEFGRSGMDLPAGVLKSRALL